MMRNNNGVSLCMIVKNESKNIRACLDSVRHLVDEMIIVDTGSDDNTAQIAADLGAKVYRYEWDDNFASARNFGLRQATKEWILVLDADERMENISIEAFTQLLNDCSVQGYYFTIRSPVDTGREYVEDHVVRLFRNHKAYRFQGAIHEQVAGSIQEANHGEGLLFAGITIFHTGYIRGNLTELNKFERNVKVILRALHENPRDPFLLYSLGMEYIQAGDHAAGQQYLENSLASMQGEEGYLYHALCSLLLSLYHSGNHEKLKELLVQSRRAFPDNPDIKIISGLQALAAGDYEQGVKLLSLDLTEANTLVPVFYRAILMGDACLKLSRYKEAEAYYYQAYRLAPEFAALYIHPRNLLLIYTQLIASGDWGTALSALIMAMLSASARDEKEVLQEGLAMVHADIAKLGALHGDDLLLRYFMTLLEQLELYHQCLSGMMLHNCLWPGRSFTVFLADALECLQEFQGIIPEG